ncbi:MAG: LLM class flavin-dependent oxidoreductase, partial [Kutzneria sp.]|nr:LLM class flavin-dependent oxidoreductase [Kutzneria sp.]
QTDSADLEPKPHRAIPIWLGTFGDRALAVTGRLADGWIPSLGYAPTDQLVVMRGTVLAAARAAGREPESITCALNIQIRIDDSADRQPSMVTGSTDSIVRQLVDFQRMGFTAFNFIPAGPDREEQTERLAHEVVPAVIAAC